MLSESDEEESETSARWEKRGLSGGWKLLYMRVPARHSHSTIHLFTNFFFKDLPPLCSAFAWLPLSLSCILRCFLFPPEVALTRGGALFGSSSDSPLKWRGKRGGLVPLTSVFNSAWSFWKGTIIFS